MGEKFFEYGKEETDFLKNSDEKMKELIENTPHIFRTVHEDVFCSLVYSIAGQQISNKAHETVFNRLKTLAGEITPKKISALTAEKIASCGMSLRKAQNIFDLAKKETKGEICLEDLKNLSDDEAIKQLTSLKGVGKWTAEMTLIFCFERKDILSFGDFGIKKGLKILYGDDVVKKQNFLNMKQKFSPYATIASFYLWELANKRA